MSQVEASFLFEGLTLAATLPDGFEVAPVVVAPCVYNGQSCGLTASAVSPPEPSLRPVTTKRSKAGHDVEVYCADGSSSLYARWVVGSWQLWAHFDRADPAMGQEAGMRENAHTLKAYIDELTLEPRSTGLRARRGPFVKSPDTSEWAARERIVFYSSDLAPAMAGKPGPWSIEFELAGPHGKNGVSDDGASARATRAADAGVYVVCDGPVYQRAELGEIAEAIAGTVAAR